jgi:predicted nucleic acid-binding Zn ribbon protein
MVCIKCGTSVPSYASVCSGCTRDIDNGFSSGEHSEENMIFLIVISVVIGFLLLL